MESISLPAVAAFTAVAAIIIMTSSFRRQRSPAMLLPRGLDAPLCHHPAAVAVPLHRHIFKYATSSPASPYTATAATTAAPVPRTVWRRRALRAPPMAAEQAADKPPATTTEPTATDEAALPPEGDKKDVTGEEGEPEMPSFELALDMLKADDFDGDRAAVAEILQFRYNEQHAVAAQADELREYGNKVYRALAQAKNEAMMATHRADRDVSDAKKYALTGFAEDLIMITDNLKRSIDAIPAEMLSDDQESDLEKITNYLRAMHEGAVFNEQAFQDILSKHNIVKFLPAIGDEVDPNLMDVTFQVPTDDPKMDGLVAHVATDGYKISDRCLRPASVGSFTCPDMPDDDDDDDNDDNDDAPSEDAETDAAGEQEAAEDEPVQV